MDQIEGFRQYLGVAEEDRLECLNPPDKTPELFERFLPYAVALDVENAWAKRFAGVLAAAGARAAARLVFGQPRLSAAIRSRSPTISAATSPRRSPRLDAAGIEQRQWRGELAAAALPAAAAGAAAARDGEVRRKRRHVTRQS